jgi:uncharacterized protein (DUF1501 family)
LETGMKKLDSSRRAFLAKASQLSVAGAAAPFAMNMAAVGAAAAQSASDYKALVCVFMYGANDHYNTVIPLDTPSYNAYKNSRASIARSLNDLNGADGKPLELVPNVALSGANAGLRFALPKELAALKTLWDNERLAVLANVGPLLVPTTKAQYVNRTVPIPIKLFSHNDQQSTWQAGYTEGAPTGWGGRIGDLFAAQNGEAVFTCTSATGDAIWLTGNSTRGYQVTPGGSVRINPLVGNLFGSASATETLRSLLVDGGSHVFTQELVDLTKRSIVADATLTTALASTPALELPAEQANNALAAQLRIVARMMAARNTLSIKRQIFFVGLTGFDTHNDQLTDQPALHAKLAGALAYFNDALNALNLANQVTTFTASDFGRTLTSNGDGSDHGWGAHHFVMGGAVKGGRFYGKFPVMGLNTNDEVGAGRLLPSTSVDEYAGALAKWFGVSTAGLGDVFPNFNEFASNNLAFFG